MKRKNLFLIVNNLIPLALGLVIYLLCYKSTYINTTFENIFGFSLPYFYFDNTFHRFITCWACDILWAYSLTFALFICLNTFKNALFISGIIAILFSIGIELLQINDIINGTFDIVDIFIEVTIIIFAIIKIKRRYAV